MSLSKIYDESNVSIKWQTALAVGGCLVVGAGMYYYLKKSKLNGKKDSKDIVDSIKDELPEEPKTPLEKAQAVKGKGNKYFKGGKFQESIKCYDEAISLCPSENSTDLSTFYQNRAAAYEQMKNWENVMRDCTAALELNKRYLKALQRRAKACEVLKDLEQALEDLTAVCILENFTNQGNLVNVERVLKQLAMQHAKEAMETREPINPSRHYIKSYFRSFVEDPIYNSLYKEKEGDVDESEHPPGKNSSNNGYLMAKQNLQEGNCLEIVNCCSNELSNPLSPFTSESLLLRGTMYILRGQNKLAMEDLNTLINMDDVPLKIKVNGLIKRATLLMQEEKVDACLADFDKASTDDPINSDVFHHMGQINLLVGNVEGAVMNFKKAVELNKNSPIAAVQKCYTDYRIAQQLNDKVKVEQICLQFEEVIKNFPKCVECYILYAQVLSDQSNFEKANDLYLKAIEVEPENPTNLVHKALLVIQMDGNVAEFRKLVNDALEIDDQCELAYENLATIEVQTGNLKRGIELFDKAIPLSRTIMEMAHLYSLRNAAIAQTKIMDKLGITIPNLGSMM